MQFYTYMWLREDGTPYYVGKGKGDRGFKTGHHLVPCPKDLSRILVQEFLSENDALEAEKILIAHYGRKDLGTGILRNRTEGGDGVCNLSAESKNKIREALKGNTNGAGHKKSEAAKDKIRRALIGNTNGAGHRVSVTHRQKLNEARRTSPLFQIHCHRWGLAMKGKPWSAARRAAQERRG